LCSLGAREGCVSRPPYASCLIPDQGLRELPYAPKLLCIFQLQWTDHLVFVGTPLRVLRSPVREPRTAASCSCHRRWGGDRDANLRCQNELFYNSSIIFIIYKKKQCLLARRWAFVGNLRYVENAGFSRYWQSRCASRDLGWNLGAVLSPIRCFH
jgi:hypothetical protein